MAMKNKGKANEVEGLAEEEGGGGEAGNHRAGQYLGGKYGVISHGIVICIKITQIPFIAYIDTGSLY